MVTVTLHVNNLIFPFERMLICKHKKIQRTHEKSRTKKTSQMFTEPRKQVKCLLSEGYVVSRVGQYRDGNNK